MVSDKAGGMVRIGTALGAKDMMLLLVGLSGEVGKMLLDRIFHSL